MALLYGGLDGQEKQNERRRSSYPRRGSFGLAVGAAAVGAFAVGAFAIGALAIRKLAIRSGRIEKLSIGELTVNRLVIVDSATRERG